MLSYSDIERCLWTAADATQRETRIMFIGDSRVRELFHEFVDIIIGTPRTYVRTHAHQLVIVDRLRLRAVRKHIASCLNVRHFCSRCRTAGVGKGVRGTGLYHSSSEVSYLNHARIA